MERIKKVGRSSIDEAQASTVEEHFKVIMADDTYIDTEIKKITSDDLPDWFDETLFKKGQEYYQRYLLGFISSYLSGLIAVFLIPSIAKILKFTNKSSVPCTAFTRYLRTSLYLLHMHTSDVMDSNSKFYKSINAIRRKHSTSSKHSLLCKQNGILQRDMVLTQFGFVGYVLVHPEVVNLSNSAEERQGIHHLWRVVGHLLGIPDRMNLCRKNECETTLLCKILLKEIYQKNLKQPTEEFHILTTAALKGISSIDPTIDLDSYLTFFYKINGMTYEKQLSTYSKLNYILSTAKYYSIGLPLVGNIFRIFWNVYLRSLLWMFERAPIIGILKYGFKKSKIQLYHREAL